MLNRAQSASFRVSEIAGGSHSAPHSRHYAGVAFEVDIINGHGVGALGSDEKAFMQGCRTDGATEVLFEGNQLHCGW